VEEAVAVVAAVPVTVPVTVTAEAEVVVVFLFVALFFLALVAETEVGAVVVVVVTWLPAAAAKVVVEASGNAARMEALTEMGTFAVVEFEASSSLVVGSASATLAVKMVASSCPLPIKLDGEKDKLPRALLVLAAAELSIIP
jgi:hypothetical protein